MSLRPCIPDHQCIGSLFISDWGFVYTVLRGSGKLMQLNVWYKFTPHHQVVRKWTGTVRNRFVSRLNNRVEATELIIKLKPKVAER